MNWRRLGHWLQGRRRAREIPPALWQHTVGRYTFLARQTPAAQERLRALAQQFLDEKEFQGAGGLQVTDAMAVAIAAQACLPLLHIEARPDALRRPGSSPLVWYRGFVGVVVHPGDVVARRESVDDAGVVHHYDEVIAGEAMDDGPVMLSWAAVDDAGATAEDGYNLVVHEFAHKIDMADGAADGCPPLHAGFMGARSAPQARAQWRATWTPVYADFREKVIIAERFGGEPTWLDPYGAQSLDEFFAVACEAYFVNRERFGLDFAALLAPLDAFFGTAEPSVLPGR